MHLCFRWLVSTIGIIRQTLLIFHSCTQSALLGYFPFINTLSYKWVFISRYGRINISQQFITLPLRITPVTLSVNICSHSIDNQWLVIVQFTLKIQVHRRTGSPARTMFFHHQNFFRLLPNIQTALVILLVLIKSPPYSGIKEPFPLILKTIIQSYIIPISGNSTRNTIFHPCKGRTILIAESFPIITPIIIYRTINIIIIQTEFWLFMVYLHYKIIVSKKYVRRILRIQSHISTGFMPSYNVINHSSRMIPISQTGSIMIFYTNHIFSTKDQYILYLGIYSIYP